ncbi:MAG: hypothetical protein VKL41_12510 [Snowella sp.]|nr:hypothetical protein [Snowella sp.]
MPTPTIDLLHKYYMLALFYHSRQKIDRNYEEKSSLTENLLVYLTGRINGKILAEFDISAA